jgi:hypothetical protein
VQADVEEADEAGAPEAVAEQPEAEAEAEAMVEESGADEPSEPAEQAEEAEQTET